MDDRKKDMSVIVDLLQQMVTTEEQARSLVHRLRAKFAFLRSQQGDDPNDLLDDRTPSARAGVGLGAAEKTKAVNRQQQEQKHQKQRDQQRKGQQQHQPQQERRQQDQKHKQNQQQEESTFKEKTKTQMNEKVAGRYSETRRRQNIGEKHSIESEKEGPKESVTNNSMTRRKEARVNNDPVAKERREEKTVHVDSKNSIKSSRHSTDQKEKQSGANTVSSLSSSTSQSEEKGKSPNASSKSYEKYNTLLGEDNGKQPILVPKDVVSETGETGKQTDTSRALPNTLPSSLQSSDSYEGEEIKEKQNNSVSITLVSKNVNEKEKYSQSISRDITMQTLGGKVKQIGTVSPSASIGKAQEAGEKGQQRNEVSITLVTKNVEENLKPFNTATKTTVSLIPGGKENKMKSDSTNFARSTPTLTENGKLTKADPKSVVKGSSQSLASTGKPSAEAKAVANEETKELGKVEARPKTPVQTTDVLKAITRVVENKWRLNKPDVSNVVKTIALYQDPTSRQNSQERKKVAQGNPSGMDTKVKQQKTDSKPSSRESTNVSGVKSKDPVKFVGKNSCQGAEFKVSQTKPDFKCAIKSSPRNSAKIIGKKSSPNSMKAKKNKMETRSFSKGSGQPGTAKGKPNKRSQKTNTRTINPAKSPKRKKHNTEKKNVHSTEMSGNVSKTSAKSLAKNSKTFHQSSQAKTQGKLNITPLSIKWKPMTNSVDQTKQNNMQQKSISNDKPFPHGLLQFCLSDTKPVAKEKEEMVRDEGMLHKTDGETAMTVISPKVSAQKSNDKAIEKVVNETKSSTKEREETPSRPNSKDSKQESGEVKGRNSCSASARSSSAEFKKSSSAGSTKSSPVDDTKRNNTGPSKGGAVEFKKESWPSKPAALEIKKEPWLSKVDVVEVKTESWPPKAAFVEVKRETEPSKGEVVLEKIKIDAIKPPCVIVAQTEETRNVKAAMGVITAQKKEPNEAHPKLDVPKEAVAVKKELGDEVTKEAAQGDVAKNQSLAEANEETQPQHTLHPQPQEQLVEGPKAAVIKLLQAAERGAELTNAAMSALQAAQKQLDEEAALAGPWAPLVARGLPAARRRAQVEEACRMVEAALGDVTRCFRAYGDLERRLPLHRGVPPWAPSWAWQPACARAEDDAAARAVSAAEGGAALDHASLLAEASRSALRDESEEGSAADSESATSQDAPLHCPDSADAKRQLADEQVVLALKELLSRGGAAAASSDAAVALASASMHHCSDVKFIRDILKAVHRRPSSRWEMKKLIALAQEAMAASKDSGGVLDASSGWEHSDDEESDYDTWTEENVGMVGTTGETVCVDRISEDWLSQGEEGSENFGDESLGISTTQETTAEGLSDDEEFFDTEDSASGLQTDDDLTGSDINWEDDEMANGKKKKKETADYLMDPEDAAERVFSVYEIARDGEGEEMFWNGGTVMTVQVSKETAILPTKMSQSTNDVETDEKESCELTAEEETQKEPVGMEDEMKIEMEDVMPAILQTFSEAEEGWEKEKVDVKKKEKEDPTSEVLQMSDISEEDQLSKEKKMNDERENDKGKEVLNNGTAMGTDVDSEREKETTELAQTNEKPITRESLVKGLSALEVILETIVDKVVTDEKVIGITTYNVVMDEIIEEPTLEESTIEDLTMEETTIEEPTEKVMAEENQREMTLPQWKWVEEDEEMIEATVKNEKTRDFFLYENETVKALSTTQLTLVVIRSNASRSDTTNSEHVEETPREHATQKENGTIRNTKSTQRHKKDIRNSNSKTEGTTNEGTDSQTQKERTTAVVGLAESDEVSKILDLTSDENNEKEEKDEKEKNTDVNPTVDTQTNDTAGQRMEDRLSLDTFVRDKMKTIVSSILSAIINKVKQVVSGECSSSDKFCDAATTTHSQENALDTATNATSTTTTVEASLPSCSSGLVDEAASSPEVAYCGTCKKKKWHPSCEVKHQDEGGREESTASHVVIDAARGSVRCGDPTMGEALSRAISRPIVQPVVHIFSAREPAAQSFPRDTVDGQEASQAVRGDRQQPGSFASAGTSAAEAAMTADLWEDPSALQMFVDHLRRDGVGVELRRLPGSPRRRGPHLRPTRHRAVASALGISAEGSGGAPASARCRATLTLAAELVRRQAEGRLPGGFTPFSDDELLKLAALASAEAASEGADSSLLTECLRRGRSPPSYALVAAPEATGPALGPALGSGLASVPSNGKVLGFTPFVVHCAALDLEALGYGALRMSARRAAAQEILDELEKRELSKEDEDPPSITDGL